MFKLMGRIQNWVLAVAGFATAGLFGISVTDIRGCMSQRPKAAVSAQERVDIERKLKLSGLLTGRSPSGDRWEEAIAQYAATIKKAQFEGLAVSDNELAQALLNQFKTKDQYRQFAQQIQQVHGVKTHEIEDFYRDQILMQKSMNLPLITAYVTQNELNDEFHRREDTMIYDRVLVKTAEMKVDAEISDEEKRAYFEEMSIEDGYQVPAKVRIDYLFVNPEQMEIGELSEENYRNYYNQHRDRFASTEFPGEAQPYFEVREEVARAYEKDARDGQAKALLSQLDDMLLQDVSMDLKNALSAAQAKDASFNRVLFGTTEPFAEKDYRVEPLGYVFNLGTRLFGKNARNYGGVLEAGNGFYIYKVAETIEGRAQTFEEALEKVTNALMQKKKSEKAEALAKEWKSKLEASADWSALTFDAGVTYNREEVKGIFGNEASKAMKMSGNAVSDPFESNEAFALVRKVERKVAEEALLAEQKEQIKEGLLRQKAQTIQFARYTQASSTTIE